MFRGFLLPSVVFPVLVLGFLSACSTPSSSSTVPIPDSHPIIRYGELEDRFLLTGELRAVRSQSLVTPHSPTWRIGIQWLAPEGSRVRQGDPVVEFDSSAFIERLEDKKLAMAEAEKKWETTRITLEVQRLEKTLDLERKGLVREKARLEAEVPASVQSLRDHQAKQLDFREADVDFQNADRELVAFEESVTDQVEILSLLIDKARRDLERSESAMESLTLHAPADGILLHAYHPWEGKKWEVGDTVWAGITVAEVPDLSAMRVEAWLSDVDDGQVLPGMPAQCRLDTFPERVFPGRVRSVGKVAGNPESASTRRFFLVEVELEESDPRIMRPGMSVRVEVLRRHWKDVPIVSRRYLTREGDAVHLNPGDGTRRRVQLLGCDWTECALAAAIPGERREGGIP